MVQFTQEIEYIDGIPQHFTLFVLSNIQLPRDIPTFIPRAGYTAYLQRLGFDSSIFDGIKGTYNPGALENLAFRLISTLFVLKKLQNETAITQDENLKQLLIEINSIFRSDTRVNLELSPLEIPYGPSNNSVSFTSVSEKYNFPVNLEIPIIDNDDFEVLFNTIIQRYTSL